MWKSLLTFTVAALLATPVFAQADGKWTFEFPNNGGSVTAEFKVEEFKLTGTMTFVDSRRSEVEITDGSIIADQINFRAEPRDRTGWRYLGRVSGNELTLWRAMRGTPSPTAPWGPPWITLKRVQ